MTLDEAYKTINDNEKEIEQGAKRFAIDEAARILAIEGQNHKVQEEAFEDLAIEVWRLRKRQTTAVHIIEQLVDEDDCSFDHHGYCQEHSWFDTEEKCPDARAKEFLASLKEAPHG